MKALVTGGAGTLGRLVVPRPQDAGCEIRVLTRHSREGGADTEFVIGDLASGEGVQGAEIIVHCAGTKKGDEAKAPRLVQAASRAGTRHLVYIWPAAAWPSASSAATRRTPGYQWHPASTGGGWTFEDNVSHNNDGSSIYFWVNNTPPMLIDRFTAYHDRHRVRAGSYINLASYRDMTVYACQTVGVLVIAVPGSPEGSPTSRSPTRTCTSTRRGCPTSRSRSAGTWSPDQVTRVIGCDFRGGTVA